MRDVNKGSKYKIKITIPDSRQKSVIIPKGENGRRCSSES